MNRRFTLKYLTPMMLAFMLVLLAGAARTNAAPPTVGPVIRSIPLSGTGSPQTGAATPSGDSDVTQAEFAGEMDSDTGPVPYPGTIVDRSLSRGSGNGVSVPSGQKAKSN